MSKGLSIIYFSNINSKEWQIFEELCRDKLLDREDLVLIRVYMILLGIKPVSEEECLMEQMQELISNNKERLNQIFNPELHFTFSPSSLTTIGHLLKTFSLENYIMNYGSVDSAPSKKIRTF